VYFLNILNLFMKIGHHDLALCTWIKIDLPFLVGSTSNYILKISLIESITSYQNTCSFVEHAHLSYVMCKWHVILHMSLTHWVKLEQNFMPLNPTRICSVFLICIVKNNPLNVTKFEINVINLSPHMNSH
jgi:hypothetical protein